MKYQSDPHDNVYLFRAGLGFAESRCTSPPEMGRTCPVNRIAWSSDLTRRHQTADGTISAIWCTRFRLKRVIVR